jgi:hypothetical protein
MEVVVMRSSAVVCAIGCFLAGYAVAGYRVNASPGDVQVRSLPSGMNIGERVTLTFAAGSVASGMSDVDCKIAGLTGVWVQCANVSDSRDSSREQVWYDTTRVAIVKKVAR